MADDLAIDLALIPANNRKRRGLVNRTLWETLRSSIFQGKKKIMYLPNGRSKLNAEQKGRTTGSLQTSKKTPSCIFI